MRRLLAALVCLACWVVPAQGGTPAAAVRAAAADVARQPAELRQYLRYLSLYAIPEGERAQFLKVLAFHVNSLSREPDIALPVRITPDLVRVSLLDYQWDRAVWEKLADSDPYFHVKLAEVKVPAPAAPVEQPPRLPPGVQRRRASYDGGKTWIDQLSFDGGRTWVAEKERTWGEQRQQPAPAPARGKETVAHAPWLPPGEIAALALAVNSDAPILRADWFVFWTAIAKGRKGAGYYDFLGFKNRKDVEKLAGLDVEAAKRLRKEMAAILDESGVALNNRQVFWYKTLAGSYWVTLDSEESVDRKNAVRLLDGDYKHDAEEIYFSLPNELWGLAASNANGDLQETVPDNIAGDKQTTSNDTRIHVGMSCIRCHAEGIRNIDDWARATYTGDIQLTSPDPIKLKRLKQLYLSDLPRQVKRDQEIYGEALRKVNGLKSDENSRAYALAWSAYLDRRVYLADTARELGMPEAAWRKALEAYGRAGNADPILVSLLAKVPRGVRREHWEEQFAQAQQIAKTFIPLK